MKRNIARTVAVATVSAITLAGAGTAFADSSSQQALVDRYATLSGALINSQALSQNTSLSDYLSTSRATVYSMPESPTISRLSILDAPGASAILGTRLSATSVGDLNTKLLAAGQGFTNSDYQGMSALVDAVKLKSSTIDGRVTLAGAAWASSLGTLASAKLEAPKITGEPEIPQVPQGALPFGLLINKGLTQMALDSPKLFTQVTQSGVGSASANKAWKSALGSAWSNSQQDLASVVPDSCTGGLLSVVATGDSASANAFKECGLGCRAAGQYMNSELLSLFSKPTQDNKFKPAPTTGGTGNKTDKQLESVLPGILADQALTPTPSEAYGDDLETMLINKSPVCGAVSVSTRTAMANTLPNVWGSLNVP
jgi:hypothetical protein